MFSLSLLFVYTNLDLRFCVTYFVQLRKHQLVFIILNDFVYQAIPELVRFGAIFPSDLIKSSSSSQKSNRNQAVV